ncbi:hypothetical protein FACS189449_09860 [Alphaproteobacteria bacterium]|nr:hypothetical protein FACS189449_09860 [Alphaproteobacteria bacterium]
MGGLKELIVGCMICSAVVANCMEDTEINTTSWTEYYKTTPGGDVRWKKFDITELPVSAEGKGDSTRIGKILRTIKSASGHGYRGRCVIFPAE